jgi:hypothetical protein
MSLYAAHERAKVQSFFENQRLSRETREADNHLLATVGDWMVRAGTALKRRYREAEALPAPRPTIRLEPQR